MAIKKNILAIGLLTILAIMLMGCEIYVDDDNDIGNGNDTNGDNDTDDDVDEQKDPGLVYIAVTDLAANMSQVEDVEIRIDSIELLSAEQGWIIVTEEDMTFMLMDIQDELRFINSVAVAEGNINQIRLEIDDVEVHLEDGSTEDARLPSSVMRINNPLRVQSETSNVIILDFVLNDSLHQTDDGEYIMAPVLRVRTVEDVDVEIDDDELEFEIGDDAGTEVVVGMDIRGVVGPERRISPNANITVDIFNRLQISGSDR